jgi:hypothetical protein
MFFWAVVSDEINRVIEFFPTRWQAERMLAKVLWDEPAWQCPAYRRNAPMKLRKSRPSIAACIGRMIVRSAPKRPDASPERNTVAASTHSSAVMPTPFRCQTSSQTAPFDADRAINSRDRRGGISAGVMSRGVPIPGVNKVLERPTVR